VRRSATSSRPGASAPRRVGAKQQEILEAAARVFRLKGYDGTTLRDIAREAGLFPGSLYYHIRSKEDLLRGIVEQPIRDLLPFVEYGTITFVRAGGHAQPGTSCRPAPGRRTGRSDGLLPLPELCRRVSLLVRLILKDGSHAVESRPLRRGCLVVDGATPDGRRALSSHPPDAVPDPGR